MHALAYCLVAAFALLAQPATAQDQDNRYSLAPTPDGFLRLDTRTGAVSECRRADDGYQCRLVAEERNALQAEIERLQRENKELRQRLAAAGDAAPGAPGAPPEPGIGPSSPSEAEIDRALGIMERFLRRFMNILREEGGRTI